MLSNKTIGERLKECRKAKKENQEDLAKLLNVQRQIISYYETGARTPNIEDLAILAKHFDTTVDYLIGLSDVKSTNIEVKSICDYTGLSEKAINSLHENFADRAFPEYLKQEDIEETMSNRKRTAEILSALIVGVPNGSLILSAFYLELYFKKDREIEKNFKELNNCESFSKENCISLTIESNIKRQLQQLHYYEAIDSFKYAVDDYLKKHKQDNTELYDSVANKFRGETDGKHN